MTQETEARVEETLLWCHFAYWPQVTLQPPQ